MSAFVLFFYFVSTIPIEAEYALLSPQQLFSGALFQSPESCLALSLLTLEVNYRVLWPTQKFHK